MAAPTTPAVQKPVVVEIRTDAFAGNVGNVDIRPPVDGVRRPLRGFEVKEDTYAILKVIRADGTAIPLTDAAGPLSIEDAGDSIYRRLDEDAAFDSELDPGETRSPLNKTSTTRKAATYNYANFLIQRISESRQEKAQVLETFGDTFVFFFGERPRVLEVQGILMNTLDFNWRSEFWYNYENVLRGTKLVEQNARIYLFYDDLVVEGYMLGATAQDLSDMPYQIPFSFQLFVTNHQYLGAVGKEDYPITHAVDLTPLLTSTEVEAAKAQLTALGIQVHKSATLVNTLTQIATMQAVIAGAGGVAPSALSTLVSLTQAKNKRDVLRALNRPLMEALTLGVTAASLAFLNNVKNYFTKGKPVPPTRTLPYRTKLRDNKDEFVKNYEGHVKGRNSYWDVRQQKFKNGYEAKSAVIRDLNDSGVDVYERLKSPPSFWESHSVDVAPSQLVGPQIGEIQLVKGL